jgi:hypothetical protein
VQALCPRRQNSSFVGYSVILGRFVAVAVSFYCNYVGRRPFPELIDPVHDI